MAAASAEKGTRRWAVSWFQRRATGYAQSCKRNVSLWTAEHFRFVSSIHKTLFCFMRVMQDSNTIFPIEDQQHQQRLAKESRRATWWLY